MCCEQMVYVIVIAIFYLVAIYYFAKYKRLSFYLKYLADKLEKSQGKISEKDILSLTFPDPNLQILKNNLLQLIRTINIIAAFEKRISLFSKKKIFSLAFSEILNYISAENISILIYNPKKEVLELMAVDGIDFPHKKIELKIGEGLAGLAFKENISILSNLGHRDKRFKTKIEERENRIKNIICAPIISKGKPVGVLNVVNKLPLGVDFTNYDLVLIEIIANQLGNVLEEEELFEQYLSKKQMEKEISIAKTIQNMYLKDTFPVSSRFKMELFYKTSQMLGGDLFYFYKFPQEERYIVIIGDVSGKSVPASLIVASTITVFELLFQENQSFENLPGLVNGVLYKILKDDFYVTVLFLEIDIENDKVTFLNCGNERPMIKKREGKIEEVEISGYPLGLFPSLQFETKEYKLKELNKIYLYSDGLLDAFVKKYNLNDILDALGKLKEFLTKNYKNEIQLIKEEFFDFEFPDDTTFLKIDILDKERSA